ncbi:unnamed protein product [Cunninghamella blakesleeana]
MTDQHSKSTTSPVLPLSQPPPTAHTKQQVYDSDTDTISSDIWSPHHNTIGGTLSSAATLTDNSIKSKDQKTLETSSSGSTSLWLQRHQRRNKLHRFFFGCIGLFVLVALLGSIILWIGSSFILPSQKYTTEISHVPNTSSSSPSSNRNLHPSSTIINNPPKNT